MISNLPRSAMNVLLIFAVAISATAISTFAQAKKDQNTTHTSRWEWTDDDWRLRVAITGKAEFNEDYSDVRDVSEGGSVRIEEERAGQMRRIDFRRDVT